MAKNDRTEPANKVVPFSAAQTTQRPSEKITAFAKRHPALTVAGAVAVGVAVSALLPRKSSRRLLGKALGLAEAAAAATTAMLGRDEGDKLQPLGNKMSRDAPRQVDEAEKAVRVTAHQLERYGLAALAAASVVGRATAARAGKVGTAAAEGSHKIRALAHGIRGRMTH